MVEHDKQRDRYLASSEGAPPVPPPGGYHGARRAAAAPPDGPVVVARQQHQRLPSNALGWIALVTGILFAVLLVGALLSGATDLLYGVTLITLQLVVAGVATAAVLTRRGRMLGAVALTLAVLVNVPTVGALSALQTSASGTYDGRKSDAQRQAEAFPGVADLSSAEVLSRPSLEQVRGRAEDALAEMRRRLTDRFGYTWTQAAAENIRPERNGQGGESMLVQYTSVTWMTNEPIRDYQRKLDVMTVIEEVLLDHGMYGLYSFNDPSSGIDDGILERFYGGTDPRTQDTWEWYSDEFPDPLRFYAMIHDLSHDESGEFRGEREAQHARTGEPLEGLQLSFLAPQLLSEADREQFQERMQAYPGR